MSPCQVRIHTAVSRRFISLPARLKLSRPKTSESGRTSRILRAITLPTNPQIPVIKIFIRKNPCTKAGNPEDRFRRKVGLAQRYAEAREGIDWTIDYVWRQTLEDPNPSSSEQTLKSTPLRNS